MQCYAMAKEGTLFCRDEIDISWPSGGTREVIEIDPDAQSLAFKQRVMNGVIVAVDLPANKPLVAESPYRLYEGEDARAVQAEPAAPVVVRKHGRAAKTVTEVTLLTPVPTETPIAVPEPAGPRRAAGYQGSSFGTTTRRKQ